MPAILVVDDEYVLRKFYENLLRSLGFSVVSAQNGLDALKVCYEVTTPFDLAIVDWQMPVMSGEAIKKHLEGKYPGMPIIVASGSVDPSEVKLKDKQVFLTKPFSINDLKKAINELLGSNY